jgi:YD repeat-containing protein
VLKRTVVAAACALALWQPASAVADITYIYDGPGWLIGLVDPAGDTAVYRYDAVGNLLSISRQGFLRNYMGRSPAEIRNAIASIERQTAEHRSWIANPESKIPNFRALDPRQQAALINNKWPGDIARQQEQVDILRGLLRDR